MKFLVVMVLAAVAYGQGYSNSTKCRVPEQWGAFRVMFDPSQNPHSEFQSEGYYAYDEKNKRKWRAFILQEPHYLPQRLEILTFYNDDNGDGLEYVVTLTPDLKPIRCEEQRPEHGWYSHQIDDGAEYDGSVTLGETLLVQQWIAKDNRGHDGGYRYQTVTDKGCVPIRDDVIRQYEGFTYEQFENVTSIAANSKVWQRPSGCHKSEKYIDWRKMAFDKGAKSEEQ